MDPTVTLTLIREIVTQLQNPSSLSLSEDKLISLGEDLASHFDILDTWLKHGGFTPWVVTCEHKPDYSYGVDACVNEGYFSVECKECGIAGVFHEDTPQDIDWG